MRCSIKVIVKYGLLAEIITAIIGCIGEYCLRYQTYSLAMDELFGPYFPDDIDRRQQTDDDSLLISHAYDPWYARQHHHVEWPSNHQHYDHLTGESFQLSQLNAMAIAAGAPSRRSDDEDRHQETFNHSPNHPNQHHQTFMSKLFNRLSSWMFPHSSSSTSSKAEDDNMLDHLDPRPLIVLSVLITLNMIFIFAVCMEYLALIGVMATTWLLYLIMLFVIVRVMNDETAKRYANMIINNNNAAASSTAGNNQIHNATKTSTPSTTPIISSNINIDWSSLLPSPFIILVVIIILLFSIILIALITEERRQIAARIRARSACIPLVKSRDMDLDDI